VALALGGSMAGGYRLFESGDGLRRALFKLEAALPEEYRADVRAARERILFDSTAWHKRPATPVHLETVRAAVWGARQIDMLYPRSQGTGDQWRRAEPHGLVCKAGVWYLVAYCHIRKGFRTFRIDRIKDVRIREETTTPRPGFNLEEYWEESRRQFERQVNPFTLTLSVSQSALRRIGSSGEIVRDEADGRVVVSVELPSQEEAVSYALSFGSDAQVIDPPEVRAAVTQAVREMALQYA
jgi:predicted DNA-binding transcriptional regulator YafY